MTVCARADPSASSEIPPRSGAALHAVVVTALLWLISGPTEVVAQVRPDWPKPVDDQQQNLSLSADALEYRPGEGPDDFRWDLEGWYGGDYNRVWMKSEGERNTASAADYAFDLQLLYGRFLWRYYDLQLGVRLEARTFGGDDVSRAHAVVGLEGLVPYGYDVEMALFLSEDGDVSASLSATKDFLFTQRLILQPQIETNAAVQEVERFTTGSGLNNVELGLRLRYEIRRKFGPYIGASFDWSVFETADLVRAEGGGGARGIAHIGVLRALAEAEIQPTVYAGSSAGALAPILTPRSLASDASIVFPR